VNVYIVGKGAMGTYVGDLLRGVGVEVAYAPRNHEEVRPYDADVAIVATKAYDTESAIETLRRAIAYPEKCVFVSPQNGVGNEERLAASFGAENVVAAAPTAARNRTRSRTARDGLRCPRRASVMSAAMVRRRMRRPGRAPPISVSAGSAGSGDSRHGFGARPLVTLSRFAFALMSGMASLSEQWRARLMKAQSYK